MGKNYKSNEAHCSVVMGVRSVTERSLVQIPLWSLDVGCCKLRQDTLSTLSQSIQLKLGAGLRWGLTCGVLVSHPEGVNDSHPLSTTETRDKHRPYAPSWHRKGFNLALNYKSIWASTLILRLIIGPIPIKGLVHVFFF